MDLLPLNSKFWHNTPFDPDNPTPAMVQGYDSLIWTERYVNPGEFQLKTAYSEETQSLLPIDSSCTIRDSDEVMMVEDHLIEVEDETDAEILTVTGRTMDGWLENRTTFTLLGEGGPTAIIRLDSNGFLYPTEHAAHLINNHTWENTTIDDPTEATSELVCYVDAGITHIGDHITGISKDGPLLDEVIRLLNLERAGIRCRKPQADPDNLPPYMVEPLTYIIYTGVDRSVTGGTSNPVIFDTNADHMLDPKILKSIRNYKNEAYVISPVYKRRVRRITDSASILGMKKRVLYVDASDITTENLNGKNASLACLTRGRQALAAQNRYNFIEGEISPTTDYIYGVDYNLGDLVTVMGTKYGISQTMRVTEYTRIEDELGERGYPTLSTVS